MKMTFKRGVIGCLMTVTAFVGLYLGFFNHPPAADTLEVNAHHQIIGKVGPPKFSDFGHSKAKQSDGIIRSIEVHNDTAKLANGGALRDPVADLIADIFASTKGPELGDAHRGNGYVDKPDLSAVNDKQLGVDSSQKAESAAVKDELNSTKPSEQAKDKVNAVISKDQSDTATEGDEKSVTVQNNLPKFDWDKWVKDNGFVDVGTMWGYCDKPDPPVIGKVLLVKDEDRGGLKIVVAMNTTFDKPVEYGFIFVSVMYGEMNFYEKNLDICSLFEDKKLDPEEEKDTFFDCPMSEGSKHYIKELHVPFFIPSGHFRAKAKLTDHLDRTVLCASADMTL